MPRPGPISSTLSPGATPAAAAMWYRKAAEAGDPDAQARLAGMYREGIGVPRDADFHISPID